MQDVSSSDATAPPPLQEATNDSYPTNSSMTINDPAHPPQLPGAAYPPPTGGYPPYSQQPPPYQPNAYFQGVLLKVLLCMYKKDRN
jgi:hypothetical protein